MEEEKDADLDPTATTAGRADGVANVGVAIALHEACTAHPELVQSHGPLSAPILRAMLGLDPYKAVRQDDAQALGVAAHAVALSRGLQRSDPPVAGGGDGGAPGRAILRRRPPAPAAAGAGEREPPSPSRRSNSSSSSEASTSEEEGEVLGRKGSLGNIANTAPGRLASWMGGSRHSRTSETSHNRGRQPSWMGGSRHSRTSETSQPYQHQQQQQHMMFQQQQQQMMIYQQQQQMQLHYQHQQQQRASQQDLRSSTGGGMSFHTRAGAVAAVPLSASVGGQNPVGQHVSDTAQGHSGAPYPGVGAYGLGGLGTITPPAFEPSAGYSNILPVSSSHSTRSAGGTSKSSGRRGLSSRTSSHRRMPSGSAGGALLLCPPPSRTSSGRYSGPCPSGEVPSTVAVPTLERRDPPLPGSRSPSTAAIPSP